jgi:hypothetical protein
MNNIGVYGRRVIRCRRLFLPASEDEEPAKSQQSVNDRVLNMAAIPVRYILMKLDVKTKLLMLSLIKT